MNIFDFFIKTPLPKVIEPTREHKKSEEKSLRISYRDKRGVQRYLELSNSMNDFVFFRKSGPFRITLSE